MPASPFRFLAGKARAISVAAALAGSLLALVWLLNRPGKPDSITAAPTAETPTDIQPFSSNLLRQPLKPETLDELLALPLEDLGRVDLARMNLLCATGLPGAEHLEVEASLKQLDVWAKHIALETERHIYRFQDKPESFEHSDGYFRMLMLNTVIQQDLGVHYNLERTHNVDFGNSKDLFIHGMIGDDNGGTCASMPILVAAAARRLDYPVKLATTMAHVFCRWEGVEDVKNIEVSSHGMNSYDDNYYKSWPLEITDAIVKANRFLESLTPPEELAMFLAMRGHCLSTTAN